jgi:hypothetical protein
MASSPSGDGPHNGVRAGIFCVLLLLAAGPLRAQMHKVEPPQRVTRAIAVYEWTGDLDKPTAARLVPVSLFINSHFEDAGVYLARPIPFVLDTGNLFFVELAGDRVGTFDIAFARDLVDRRSAADDNPIGVWYGFGKFAPPAAAPKVKPLKPSATLATIEGSDDDSRPHFVRRAPPKVATPSKSGSSGSSSSGSGSQPADDSDRPTMQRRPGSDTSTTTSTDDSSDTDRPTLRRRDPAEKPSKGKNKPQASVSGPANSLNDDPDRPILGHHSAEEAATPDLKGLPANMRQTAAVSDPSNREEHIFTRDWASSTEREQTLAGLEALARPRIAAYLAANKLQPVATPPAETIPTAPATSSAHPASSATPDGGPPKLRTKAQAEAEAKAATKPAPAKPAAKPATTTHHTATRTSAHLKKPSGPTQLTLYSEDLRGYELSYGGLPTFVYTVQSPVAKGGPVYLTLVAQRLPSGELQIALHSITDATHLDSVPWLRPIDVVDPDASHRASLLFELRAQHSRQFTLYRLVTAEAEQTFVTGTIE